MPLSDHEQRILAEIERRLLQEDPKFAHQVGQSSVRAHFGRRMRLWVLGFLVGLALLLVAEVVLDQVLLALGGFCLMVASLFELLRLVRRRSAVERLPSAAETGSPHPAAPPRPGPATPQAWWARLNERWQRRWEERGGPPTP